MSVGADATIIRHHQPSMHDVLDRVSTVVMSSAEDQGMSRRDLVKNTAGVAAAVSALTSLTVAPQAAEAKGASWVQVRTFMAQVYQQLSCS